MEFEGSEDGPLYWKKGINSFRYKECVRKETKVEYRVTYFSQFIDRLTRNTKMQQDE